MGKIVLYGLFYVCVKFHGKFIIECILQEKLSCDLIYD